MRVLIDIWRGPTHLARLMRPIDEAMGIALREVVGGFHVKLRGDVNWGHIEEFDNRPKPPGRT